MRDQQSFVFTIGCASITALFLGTCILSWSIYPVGISTITTIGYIIGYYLIITNGVKAYSSFVPQNDVTLDILPGAGNNYAPVGDGKSAGISGGGVPGEVNARNPHELKKTKFKGVLWLRKPAEEGGIFTRCYGVLKDGRLDIYKAEQDYLDHLNPINKKPFKMWQFNVETDPRKFARPVTSLRNMVKSQFLGDDGQDFSFSDIMSSKDDLPYAAKHYRFALMPKVSSELQSVDNIELLGHDETCYKEWLSALRTVVNAYDEIAATPSVDTTMRMGSADVEVVVQAANL